MEGCGLRASDEMLSRCGVERVVACGGVVGVAVVCEGWAVWLVGVRCDLRLIP